MLFFQAHFYYFVMLFTFVYSFVFVLLLAGRFDYSRPTRYFGYFLTSIILLSIKDSLGTALLPLFDNKEHFARFLAIVSPLFLVIPICAFNMLIAVYNFSVEPRRQFRQVAAVNTALAVVFGVSALAAVINPALLYRGLYIHAVPYYHYTYESGPIMILYTILLAASTGIPAVVLMRLAIREHRTEAYLIGLGTLLSLMVAIATNTIPAFTRLQNLPRLGCLSMFEVCAFTFYAMYRYGKIFPVANMLQEQQRSRMIVDSMESLVQVDNQKHLFQRTCEFARDTSESMLSCIISFEEGDSSYRVQTIASRSKAIEETLCSQLPLAAGTVHALREVAGIEKQLSEHRPLEFRSLKDFFGNSGTEVTWTERVFMFDFKQIISYPILYDQKVWGALVLFRERVLEQTDLLRIFSIQCALVLRFSRQIKELERMRQLEEQLHQSQKLEAIGQLAGGIAHDFNNMLSGISGYAQLIKRRFAAEKPELKTYTDSMLAAAKSASELTEKLLAFARKGKYQTVAIDIHDTVRAVIALLERTIDRRISIGQQFLAQAPLIMGDPSQIQNMILNLALNARNAMTNGGELTFRTEIKQIDKDDISADGKYQIRAGTYMALSVIDTGTGMNDEVKKRIFEPFFTTQSGGKGTGLGLASVYGTVKSHEGFIAVESAVGFGSTFRIYLPVAVSQQVAADTFQKTQELIRGKGHILVVDDEEMIRKLSEEILTFLGYTVHTCSDGPEAIAYYSQNCNNVDLIILDVMMQKMTGYEAFVHLKKIREDLKVIIMTGYSLDEEANRKIIDQVSGFIKKPFEGAELSRMIHDVLTTGKAA